MVAMALIPGAFLAVELTRLAIADLHESMQKKEERMRALVRMSER